MFKKLEDMNLYIKGGVHCIAEVFHNLASRIFLRIQIVDVSLGLG